MVSGLHNVHLTATHQPSSMHFKRHSQPVSSVQIRNVERMQEVFHDDMLFYIDHPPIKFVQAARQQVSQQAIRSIALIIIFIIIFMCISILIYQIQTPQQVSAPCTRDAWDSTPRLMASIDTMLMSYKSPQAHSSHRIMKNKVPYTFSLEAWIRA